MSNRRILLKKQPGKNDLLQRIRHILVSARMGIVRSVNTAQILANWFVGREIVEEEQHGRKRAGYGKSTIERISRKLCKEFGGGYSADNLELFRRFYIVYGGLISDAVRRKSAASASAAGNVVNGLYAENGISDAVRRKSWKLLCPAKNG